MSEYQLMTRFSVLAYVLAISGCSSLGDITPGKAQTITIESDPPQATVLANGADLGTTPLTINPSDVFRSGFSSGGESLLGYSFVGKLIVKKPGCKEFATEVDDNILSRDINVKLECDPDYRPPSPAVTTVPVAPAMAAPAPVQAMPATAEERLLRIDALHKKGLISSEEREKLRQRVLDTL